MELVNWKQLNLRSFCILLASGNTWAPQKIQWLQRMRGIQNPAATISHVAMIVEMPPETAELFGGKVDPYGLYVTETTTLNKWCGKSGLQINGFVEWLENYEGSVYVRSVRCPELDGKNRELIAYIFEHLTNPKTRVYENGIPGLLELLLCEFGIQKAILNTAELHCTEWIAEIEKKFGVLEDIISNNRMPPCEWWDTIDVKTLSGKLKTRCSLLDKYIKVYCTIEAPLKIK